MMNLKSVKRFAGGKDIYLEMSCPFGALIRDPDGTVLLNGRGGADSSHRSSSLPSGVTKRNTTLGFMRRNKIH
jgi:hypothetical protein